MLRPCLFYLLHCGQLFVTHSGYLRPKSTLKVKKTSANLRFGLESLTPFRSSFPRSLVHCSGIVQRLRRFDLSLLLALVSAVVSTGQRTELVVQKVDVQFTAIAGVGSMKPLQRKYVVA